MCISVTREQAKRALESKDKRVNSAASKMLRILDNNERDSVHTFESDAYTVRRAVDAELVSV